MDLFSQTDVGQFTGSTPALPALARSEAPPATASSPRYDSQPGWLGERSFEVGETNRLNQAHWQLASDTEINAWLRERLSVIRARATYECRNNGMLAGVAHSLTESVVGEDGPMYQCQSDNATYNTAAERVWRNWFRAPTFRPNFSGAALLKLWVRNLPRAGEFLTTIGTDPHAEGPVKLRLRPLHPRRLAAPYGQSLNPRMVMGVEFDANERPIRYWISEYEGVSGGLTRYEPYPPDLVIHEFLVDEEGQARGFPWLTPSLQSAADLREFDDRVLDAAQQMADQSALLYTTHPDAPVWGAPESMTMQRRTLKMAPPGWQPWNYPATAPPAQYPDYRAEKHRDLGRPMGMPLLVVRMDASKHNYSSARFDSQGWDGTVAGVQNWLSGTSESYGTLNRLADLVLAEARFSVPELRRPPQEVTHGWIWPKRKHVDPSKESDATQVELEGSTENLINVLAEKGTTLERHVQALKRVVDAYTAAGVPLPAWMTGAADKATPEGREKRAQKAANEEKQTTNA